MEAVEKSAASIEVGSVLCQRAERSSPMKALWGAVLAISDSFGN